MIDLGAILLKSGFAAGATEGGQPEYKLCGTDCENCKAAGGRGWWTIPEHRTDDGILVGETTIMCEKRRECKKLGQYFDDWVKRCIESSGMPEELLKKKINDYQAAQEWQSILKRKAVEYVRQTDDRRFDGWLLLSGQSGSGKTHLCAAVANKLLADGKAVKYTTWPDLMRAVKSFDYEPLDAAKRAKVLLLDDLYKMEPSREEAKATYELIEHRYTERLVTLVTTERTANELMEIDEAVAGRIVERCGPNWANISKNPTKNWRVRDIG